MTRQSPGQQPFFPLFSDKRLTQSAMLAFTVASQERENILRHKKITSHLHTYFISWWILAIHTINGIYTRHTSSCRCVGFPHSPQSLTNVSAWGFAASPPSCNSNYFGYIYPITELTLIICTSYRHSPLILTPRLSMPGCGTITSRTSHK